MAHTIWYCGEVTVYNTEESIHNCVAADLFYNIFQQMGCHMHDHLHA
jgi:hypothetical protein